MRNRFCRLMKNKWRHINKHTDGRREWSAKDERTAAFAYIVLSREYQMKPDSWVCIKRTSDRIFLRRNSYTLVLNRRAYSVNWTVHALSLWQKFCYSLSFSRCSRSFFFRTKIINSYRHITQNWVKRILFECVFFSFPFRGRSSKGRNSIFVFELWTSVLRTMAKKHSDP